MAIIAKPEHRCKCGAVRHKHDIEEMAYLSSWRDKDRLAEKQFEDLSL